MPNTIFVTVKNKIARLSEEAKYVCGNSDYVVRFSFDEEWGEFVHKTARFVYGNEFVDVVFSGDECEVPVIFNAKTIAVGVFAGDIKTTTPALVPAIKSILSEDGSPAAPTDDVYSQIMELLNNLGENGGNGEYTETDPTVPAWAKAETKPTYTADEVGALSVEDLPEAVNLALKQAKESGEFDGEDGYTPVKGTDYFTEADKAEMVADVLATLPVYNGEVG